MEIKANFRESKQTQVETVLTQVETKWSQIRSETKQTHVCSRKQQKMILPKFEN